MEEDRIKSGRKEKFTVLYNSALQDRRLSLKAKGLFCVMMSLPENWQYSVSGLAKYVGVSKDVIRKLLQELQDVGYLIREQSHGQGGKFGGNTYVLQDEAPPLSEKTDNGENRQRSEPSTENSTQKKRSTNVNKRLSNNPPIIPPKGDDTVAMFERFWNFYPRHQHKDAALRAWLKLNPDMALCREMSHALLAQVHSDQWTRDDGRYVPLFSTWLNGRYWKDEPGPVHTPPTDPAPPDDDERRGRYL
jgi:hypothetical protein